MMNLDKNIDILIKRINILKTEVQNNEQRTHTV